VRLWSFRKSSYLCRDINDLAPCAQKSGHLIRIGYRRLIVLGNYWSSLGWLGRLSPMHFPRTGPPSSQQVSDQYFRGWTPPWPLLLP